MLRKIDLFGEEVSLNFNGKKRSSSNLGVLASLLLLAFLAWQTYHIGKDIIARQNPQTNTSETLDEDPDPIVLTPETFTFGFGLQHPDTDAHYIDETIYTVKAYVKQLTRIVNRDGSVNLVWKNMPLALERCTTSHFGALGQNFATLELNQMYCMKKEQPDLEQIRIQGMFESPIYEYVSVNILQCDNRLNSGVTCASNDTLDYMLGNGFFAVYFTNLAIDPTNYTDPNIHFRDSYYTSIGNKYFKEVTMWLNHVQVSTDSGWLLEDSSQSNFTDFDYAREILSFSPDQGLEMMEFVVRVGKISAFYSRSYIKLQDIFASVDGLRTVVIMLAGYFIGPYSEIKFYESLINELFDIKFLKKTSKKKNSNGKVSNKRSSLIKTQSSTVQKAPTPKQKTDIEITILQKENQTLDLSSSRRDLLQITESPLKPVTHREIDQIELNRASSTLQIQKSETLYSTMIPPERKGTVNIETEGNRDQSITLPQSSLREDELKSSQLLRDNGNSIGILSSKRNEFQMKLLQKRPKAISPQVQMLEKYETIGPGEINALLETIMLGNLEEGKVAGNSKQVIKENLQDSREQKEEKSSIEMVNISNIARVNEENSQMDKGVDDKVEEVMNEDLIMERGKQLHSKLSKTQDFINISVWEYIRSFFWKKGHLKEKMGILKEGKRRIHERLDIFKVFKKLRESDKLKLLLLENEQLVLFDSLPKPELVLVAVDERTKKLKSFSHTQLKETKFISDKRKHDLIAFSYKNLKKKACRTMIDEKLVEIYDDILDSVE